MLDKVNRLPSPEFREIQKTGKRIFSGNLSLNWSENQLPVSRFGFVAGTGFSKLATQRNRAKRLLREVVRRNFPKIRSGKDIVLRLKGPIDLNFDNTEKIVLAAFTKARLISS